MPQKQNNRRIYPDANRQPNHKAKFRQDEAKERQAEYDKLTFEQKIAKLPPEPYSKKQRARLQALLAKQNAPKPKPVAKESTEASTAEVVSKPAKPKKYMKQ
jgi:hypothetical protein